VGRIISWLLKITNCFVIEFTALLVMLTESYFPLGIQAETGAPISSIDDDSLAAFSAEPLETEISDEQLDAKAKSHLGTDDDVSDANDLKQTGWAILFGPGVEDDVKQALKPLIEHRQRQVANDALFKIFDGTASYVEGETAADWLAKDDKFIPMADVDPAAGVPYYVLIIGSPEQIPFEFQFGLDLYWAVGRLWFPTAAEYAQYVKSIIAYETEGSVRTVRQMAIFAPRNGEDRAMGLFTDNMANPMMLPTRTKPPFGHDQHFRLQPFLGDPATKETLDNIWLGKIPKGQPAVVFTGSHGMVFYAGDGRQAAEQGAVVCNEWKGGDTSPKRSHYYAGSDLPAEAQLHGMIHFLFDCYGAGWPRNDTYSRQLKRPAKLDEAPRLARLPQALLSHRNGGALAVLGHIDRSWSSSYASRKLGPQMEGFRTVMNRLMSGNRIGHATDKLNQRWAGLSIELAEDLQKMLNGLPVDPDQAKSKWIARDDARNYIVIGDPAVRLRVEDMPVLGE